MRVSERASQRARWGSVIEVGTWSQGGIVPQEQARDCVGNWCVRMGRGGRVELSCRSKLESALRGGVWEWCGEGGRDCCARESYSVRVQKMCMGRAESGKGIVV